MKNFYNYKQFINEHKQVKLETFNSEELNEGLFDFFKKLFNKLNDLAKKVKNSKEIDKLIDQAKKEIDAQKKNLVDVEKKANPGGAEQKKEAPTGGTKEAPTGGTKETPTSGTKEATTSGTKEVTTGTENKVPVKQGQVTKQNTSYKYDAYGKIRLFEADTASGATDKKEDPINKYISKIVDLYKQKLAPYLQNKQEDTKLYAQAKLAEIEEHVLKTKIEVYKEINLQDKVKETETELQAKNKELSTKIKDLETKLSTTKGSTLEIGKVYKYTDKENKEKLILIVADENGKLQAKTVSEDGKTPMKEDQIKDETYTPNSDSITPVDDNTQKQYAEIAKAQVKTQSQTQTSAKPGDIKQYTNKDGEVTDVVVKDNGKVATVIDKDGNAKDPKEIAGDEGFDPIKANLKVQEDEKKKKKAEAAAKLRTESETDTENF